MRSAKSRVLSAFLTFVLIGYGLFSLRNESGKPSQSHQTLIELEGAATSSHNFIVNETNYIIPRNGPTFSMSDLLELCHNGYLGKTELTITATFALIDPNQRKTDYLNTCHPIEISTSQGGRSMGHCSDFALYIKHGGGRLSSDQHDSETFKIKAKHCPKSMYIHGEYPIWSLLDLPIKNLWLPNIEQVNGEGLAKVINYKAILCKTRVTCMAFEKHFKQLNLKTPKTIFMSHSSPDTRANAIEVLGESTVRNMTQDFNKFIHLYGGSGRKSTMQVLQCWRRHPSWPTLTVIGERSVANIKKELWFGYVPSNVHILEHLPIRNLREKQLSNGVHICPSSQEGYGHYINEARALGALVLTTNHPPMNEFVDDGVSGILLKSSKVAAEGYQALAPYFISPVHVSSGSICDGIKRVMKMSLEERRRMGKLARERYESDDVLVAENIKKLVYSMAE